MSSFTVSKQITALLHSFLPKNEHFSVRTATFLKGQIELFLVTLMQNSAKITKFCQCENVFGKFSLQASSCIQSYPKEIRFRRKVQIFGGGQKDLFLVNLSQKLVKTHQIRKKAMLVQTEMTWPGTQLIVSKVLGYIILEGYFCPFKRDHSNKLPPTNLYFLKKSGDFPLNPVCRQNFSDIKVLWWYDTIFTFKHFFRKCISCLGRHLFMHFTVWYGCVVHSYLFSPNYIFLLGEVKA